ncbi:hypothetical protein [Actinomadura sp. 9N215]|uniref:hypothetical protein n=1 Tax=Actinomadura sp. 9N215 TaxID=3375150 RepID=UPI00379FAACA
MTPPDTSALLARLRADFPEWVCRYEPLFELRWEAHRRPYRYSPSGCFAWIRAESAERLREMLTAAGEIEAARKRADAPVDGGGCVR